MATIQSTGDFLHTCVSPEVFSQSVDKLRCKERKCSLGVTRGITRTTLFCIVVAICTLAIWTELPALLFKDCLPNSWMQDDLVEPTKTPYMFVYLFNWTSMYDPMNLHVRPNFVQLGPYVFRANGDMPDLRWADNDTLTSCTRTWFFDEEMSLGSLYDLVSIYHPPDPDVAKRIRSWNKYMKKVIDFTLDTDDGCLELDEAVRQWMFKGYFDPLIEIAAVLESDIIPWYFREYDMFFLKSNKSKIDINEPFSYGSCLTGDPLYMMHSNVDERGNYMNISDMGDEEFFSDDDILDIFTDISQFYAPIVIVSERVNMNQTMALLQKLACRWIDSYCLVLGTVALFLILNSLFQKIMQTKNLCVVRNQH